MTKTQPALNASGVLFGETEINHVVPITKSDPQPRNSVDHTHSTPSLYITALTHQEYARTQIGILLSKLIATF